MNIVNPAAMSPWAAMAEQARATFLTLFGAALFRLPAVFAAIVVIVATSFVARASHRWARAVGTHVIKSPSLRLLIDKSMATGIWLTGSLIAGLFLFPSLRLGDVFATLGLGSVAIGFAFQDIFKNFLAGILLLINEPFRIGDQICIAGFEGTVEHIDIRSTHLKTYKGERVLIPNSLVFTSSVEVRTAMPLRRTDVTVGVSYDADLGQTAGITAGALAQVEGVLPEPPPIVDATEFGESAITLTVRYWTSSLQADTLRTRSRAIIAIKSAYDEAGILIPFPIRTVRIEGASGTASPTATS